ncbi:MAG: AAA family ATPase [Bacillota bacterium]
MKPRLLKISGLNSFLEEQVVDFHTLTEMGIFGIFGPTGSGKSTILDAIILALYGRMPRSGGRPSGLINTHGDKVSIYYEFEIGARNQRKVYAIQRIFKRGKDDSVQTDSVKLWDMTLPGEEVVLSDKVGSLNGDIEGIIGLKVEDFTRSVVLPQGNFSDFLKLSGSDKRNMLERIFNLEKYGEDLMMKVKAHKKKKELEKHELKAIISTYGDITPESIKDLELELAMLLEEKEKLQRAVTAVLTEHETYKTVWELQQELEGYRVKQKALEEQQPVVKEKEERLLQGERAAVIVPYIHRLQEQEKSLNEVKQRAARVEESFQKIKQQLTETERSWKEIQEKKEKDYEVLIQKKSKLERAVQLQKDIKKMEEDLVKLRTEYGEMKKLHRSMEIKKEENTKNLEAAAKALEVILENIEKLKITSEERNRLEKAFELEKNYKTLLKEQKELLPKIEMLHQKKVELHRKKEAHENKEKAIMEALGDIAEKKKKLEEECPPGEDVLLEKQERISALEVLISQLSEQEEKRSRVTAELGQYNDQMTKIEERINTEKMGLETMEQAICERDEVLRSMEYQNMAGLLAENLQKDHPCPVCGSTSHPRPSISSSVEHMEDIREELQGLRQQLEEKKAKLNEQWMQQEALKAKIAMAEQAYKELVEKTPDKDLKTVIQEAATEKESLEVMKAKNLQWRKEKEENEGHYHRLKDELAAISTQSAEMKKDIENAEENLNGLEQELSKKKNSLQELRPVYERILFDLQVETVEKRMEELKRQDEALEELEKKEKLQRSLLDQLKQENEALVKEINDLTVEMAKKEESGIEKRNVVKEKVEEAALLSEGKDAAVYSAEVQKMIEEIQTSYAGLKKQYESEKKEKDSLENERIAMLRDVHHLENGILKENSAIEKLMVEKDFESLESILTCALTEEEKLELQKAVEIFKDGKKKNEVNMTRLQQKLGNRTITLEQWQELQERKKSLEESKQENLKAIAIKEKEKQEKEEKLKKSKEFLEKLHKVEQEWGLLEQLTDLFKGKRFVEFIAKRQLTYIAKEASRQLKSITRGRYALELDSECNFIIRDDHSGGARRGTYTLSGGETFVTSLSLALALSSHIQLGKASLEFFFLDEGFGTLDGELLDIVMGSLEQLHHDQLTVGVISHVEELKQRIPRKLIVSAAVPGVKGTTVTIEEN